MNLQELNEMTDNLFFKTVEESYIKAGITDEQAMASLFKESNIDNIITKLEQSNRKYFKYALKFDIVSQAMNEQFKQKLKDLIQAEVLSTIKK